MFSNIIMIEIIYATIRKVLFENKKTSLISHSSVTIKNMNFFAWFSR